MPQASEPAAGSRARRSHYDNYPYDVGVGGGELYVERGGQLGCFLAAITGGRVADVGCGPGNVLSAIAARADIAVGIDRSPVTAALARARCRDAYVVCGDALRLPFDDATMDAVLALGSLHHTGAAKRGLSEVSRVLRPGGRAFITLYRAGSYYEHMYATVGRLARASSRSRVPDLLINRLLLLPCFATYFWVGRAFVHGRLHPPKLTHTVNYFADQLLNPVVSFHSNEEVRRWSAELGLEVVESSTAHLGALHSFTCVRV